MKFVIVLVCLVSLALAGCGISYDAVSAADGPKVAALNDQNFASEVVEYDGVAVVDFSAEWCPACRELSPTIRKLAVTFNGLAKVGAVDTDDAPALVRKYQISALPTVIIFKHGKPVERLVGVRSLDEYVNLINHYLHP